MDDPMIAIATPLALLFCESSDFISLRRFHILFSQGFWCLVEMGT